MLGTGSNLVGVHYGQLAPLLESNFGQTQMMFSSETLAPRGMKTFYILSNPKQSCTGLSKKCPGWVQTEFGEKIRSKGHPQLKVM